MTELVPQSLDGFIRSFVRSVWDIELLLLLRRNAARSWRAEELVRELRGSQLIVHDALIALVHAGLVIQQQDETYRYGPASPQQEELVRQLESAYARFPAAINKLIWSAPSSKIQTFADAFRLKKD